MGQLQEETIKLYRNTDEGVELLGELITNRSLTTEEALEACGYARWEGEDGSEHPDYIHEDGTEVWVEEVLIEP